MSRSIARLRLWAALVLLAGAGLPAWADVFDLGRYALSRGEGAGTYALAIALPETIATDGGVVWPRGCRETERHRATAGGRVLLSLAARCDRAFGPGDVIHTPWRVDGAAFTTTVTGAAVSRVLQTTGEGVDLPVGEAGPTGRRPFLTVATDYAGQGIRHILGGWDHLAFVLCLCMLARGRDLLGLVTAFTIGHSISLALAFFDVIRVAAPPVEAVIALSIMFMAREGLRVPGEERRSAARQWRYLAITGGFGLLHGLGFATALGELGVAARERVEGLIFFNLGVECGQLIFVALVAMVMAVARRTGAAAALRTAALYGTGVLGSFWLFERIAAFGLSAG